MRYLNRVLQRTFTYLRVVGLKPSSATYQLIDIIYVIKVTHTTHRCHTFVVSSVNINHISSARIGISI